MYAYSQTKLRKLARDKHLRATVGDGEKKRFMTLTPGESSTGLPKKIDLFQFLDKAFSGRVRTVEKEEVEPVRKQERGDKRRFKDRSSNNDRWESNAGEFQHISNNFVSSGIYKV
jgi:hypothetical protein